MISKLRLILLSLAIPIIALPLEDDDHHESTQLPLYTNYLLNKFDIYKAEDLVQQFQHRFIRKIMI